MIYSVSFVMNGPIANRGGHTVLLRPSGVHPPRGPVCAPASALYAGTGTALETQGWSFRLPANVRTQGWFFESPTAVEIQGWFFFGPPAAVETQAWCFGLQAAAGLLHVGQR